MNTQLAEIVLYPNHFKVSGPPILVLMVEAVIRDKTLTAEQARDQMDEVLWNWHVICSVSGEPVRLYELRYWDVPKQTVYARPELVPMPECYNQEKNEKTL